MFNIFRKNYKKLATLTLLALCTLIIGTTGSALAWGGASANCVAGTYGVGAVGAGATDPLEVFYCNIFNGVTGGIGAALAICLVVFGIWKGAVGQGGWMGAVPFLIMGVALGLSGDIVGWLGTTTDYIHMLVLR